MRLLSQAVLPGGHCPVHSAQGQVMSCSQRSPPPLNNINNNNNSVKNHHSLSHSPPSSSSTLEDEEDEMVPGTVGRPSQSVQMVDATVNTIQPAGKGPSSSSWIRLVLDPRSDVGVCGG